jgi:hypothetical protein
MVVYMQRRIQLFICIRSSVDCLITSILHTMNTTHKCHSLNVLYNINTYEAISPEQYESNLTLFWGPTAISSTDMDLKSMIGIGRPIIYVIIGIIIIFLVYYFRKERRKN